MTLWFWAPTWGIFKPAVTLRLTWRTRQYGIRIDTSFSHQSFTPNQCHGVIFRCRSYVYGFSPECTGQSLATRQFSRCTFILHYALSVCPAARWLITLSEAHAHSPKRCKQGPWKELLLTTGPAALQKWGLLKAFSAAQNPAVLH